MKRTDLIDILHSIKGITVAVIGDFALDRYFIVQTTQSLGASGSVACNLSVMGSSVLAVGFSGVDGAGFDLKEEMNSLSIHDGYFYRSKEVITPQYIKTIQLEDGSRIEGNRLDIKNFNPTPYDLEQQLIDELPEVFQKSDAVVILDQMTEENCGVITRRVRDRLISLAGEWSGKVVLVDSRTRIDKYNHMIIKCNKMEACKAINPNLNEEPTIDMAVVCGKKLYEKNKKPVFVTLGKDGLLAFSKDGVYYIPTVEVPPPIDIVGAGDSVTAAVAAALSSGASVVDAGLLGNITASVTIRQIGKTGAATPEQILETYDQYFAKSEK